MTETRFLGDGCRMRGWWWLVGWMSPEADKNAFSGFDVFRNLEFNPE